MSCLIFCSFEVGGWPYKMAETLNRHGIKTYYISLDRNAYRHDSTVFHYGKRQEDWDLSSLLDRNCWNFQKNIKIIRHIKSHYGIKYCFATGHKAYLLKQAGMNYAYWSYGSDLDQCCKSPVFPAEYPLWKKGLFYLYFLLSFCREQKRSIPAEYPLWKKGLFYLYFLLRVCREQRKSIAYASSLMIIPYRLDTYQQLCPAKRLFFLPHLMNVMEYKELCKEKVESKKKICGAIGAENFFFSSTRHLWSEKNSSFADYKGNDIMLYSFSHYLKISTDKNSKLILIRKGPDVEKSEELIQELGIHNYVVWINEVRRDELWAYYQGASMCFGQFGKPALTYVVVEPLSNASPCISFVGNNDTNAPFYNTIPPILNSKDLEEIVHFISKITSDIDYASSISYNSWLWAKENCSEERFVKTFLNEMSFGLGEYSKK